jgi:hypothetical protein
MSRIPIVVIHLAYNLARWRGLPRPRAPLRQVFLSIPFACRHPNYPRPIWHPEMCLPMDWAHVSPLLLQPPCPRAWLAQSRHLLLEAPVRSYRKSLHERALLLPLYLVWSGRSPGRWRGFGGVQRSSRPVAAVGIVGPPSLVGARRPARREWPGCPAAASLGWSRRKSAACAGFPVEKVAPPRVG